MRIVRKKTGSTTGGAVLAGAARDIRAANQQLAGLWPQEKQGLLTLQGILASQQAQAQQRLAHWQQVVQTGAEKRLLYPTRMANLRRLNAAQADAGQLAGLLADVNQRLALGLALFVQPDLERRRARALQQFLETAQDLEGHPGPAPQFN